jgi:hypothetical protein
MTNQHTMRLREPESALEKQTEISPFLVEYFMVQALGFRGMAYCDQEGRWRNVSNNDQLLGRIYLLD